MIKWKIIPVIDNMNIIPMLPCFPYAGFPTLNKLFMWMPLAENLH